MSMRCRHTKPDQFELFDPPHGTYPLQTPLWQNLPQPTRYKITGLMARLLMEHDPGHEPSPEEEAGNQHQSKESDDV